MEQQNRIARMNQVDASTEEPPIRPKFSMFSREDCLRIHRASCEILRQTGVRVYSPAAIRLLRDAGALVEENLVKIPPSLVEGALASVPGSFNLYKRGGDQVAIRLDGQEIYFGPGSDTFRYLDPRTGNRRDFLLADVGDCARLVDALPELHFTMSVGVPRDVPEDTYYRHQFAAMLRNTSKPIVVVCDTKADMETITAIAAAAAGGLDKLV
jgi:trimethylamine--corrinoid protein Co-methyltransferase